MNKQEKLDLRDKQLKYELVMKKQEKKRKKLKRTRIMISLGKQIQIARKIRGHKISTLAYVMTGKSNNSSIETYLRHIEAGKSNPTIKYLQRLARALDCELHVDFIMKTNK